MQTQTQDIDQSRTNDQDEHEGQYYCGICGWVDLSLFPNCHVTQKENDNA